MPEIGRCTSAPTHVARCAAQPTHWARCPAGGGSDIAATLTLNGLVGAYSVYGGCGMAGTVHPGSACGVMPGPLYPPLKLRAARFAGLPLSGNSPVAGACGATLTANLSGPPAADDCVEFAVETYTLPGETDPRTSVVGTASWEVYWTKSVRPAGWEDEGALEPDSGCCTSFWEPSYTDVDWNIYDPSTYTWAGSHSCDAGDSPYVLAGIVTVKVYLKDVLTLPPVLTLAIFAAADKAVGYTRATSDVARSGYWPTGGGGPAAISPPSGSDVYTHTECNFTTHTLAPHSCAMIDTASGLNWRTVNVTNASVSSGFVFWDSDDPADIVCVHHSQQPESFMNKTWPASPIHDATLVFFDPT